MSTKGGSYEWECIRKLSLWFSGGRHDDWYARSSTSGGRAATRAKCGKRTIGHCGDMAATCSEAEPLLKLITPEFKRGYGVSAFMADLLDRDVWPTGKGRKLTMMGMVEQARGASARAGTPYWALVHRRDKRGALLYLPRELYDQFAFRKVVPRAMLTVGVAERKSRNALPVGIAALRFDDFLNYANPNRVKELLKKWEIK